MTANAKVSGGEAVRWTDGLERGGDMDIKAAHIDINARTKTERGNVPVFSECELRISIGHFGFADIAIWQKAGKGPQQGDFGLIATLTIYNPADMVRLANGLLALANAAEVIERSNA